jgi:hypothetical protein
MGGRSCYSIGIMEAEIILASSLVSAKQEGLSLC